MHDLRLAVRSLTATPVVSAVAVLSLTLGIGANIAIFSLVNGLLLRTLPVRAPDRLVLVSDASANGALYWSLAVFDQIHKRDLFEDVGGWVPTRFNLAARGETQFVDGLWVTGSYLDTLGVRAVLGRNLSDADDRRGGGVNGAVMMISYGFWQRRFGGTPDVIGRPMDVNGVPVTIVGVTPPDFFGTDVGRAFDLMLTFGEEPLINGRDSVLNGGVMNAMVIGRLKAGQTVNSAVAALRAAQPEIRASALPPAAARDPDPYLRDFLKNPFTLVPAEGGNNGFGRRYADVVYASLRESPQATMYLPLAQHDEPFFVRSLRSVNLNIRSSSVRRTRWRRASRPRSSA